MTVIENINEINKVLKAIFEFIQSEETIKSDFEEYMSTIGARNISLNQIEKVFLPYIFERNINEQSILEMFRGRCTGKANGEEYINITDCLLKAKGSVFEIKKMLKNGFELYDLINEKIYTVLSLTKMTNFRGVYAGQYMVGRIFEKEGEYYIIEISNILSHSQKEEAYRYAVLKLVNNPKLLYMDNKEKESEIKNTIAEMYDKFIKVFNKDIILTTNKYADEIIGSFNEGEDIDIKGKESNIQEYKFFHVKELENNYSNFIERSMGGFSSHNETYDVAVIFDKEKGLYAIPFYETFCKIFDEENNVENAKACVEYFLNNDSIPNTILDRVSSEHSNFMEVINRILEEQYTYEELIKKYKSEFLESTIYSSATVLFCSNAFSNVFEYISSELEKPEQPQLQKVGRNELCPCGSGKKYKNCCGK